MAVSICFVPLVTATTVSVSALTRHLVEAWPSLPAIEETQDKGATLSFRMGLADVIVAHMPVGIALSDIDGPSSVAVLWPGATADLGNHSAHLIVTVSGELDPTTMSTLLTQVTASLLAVCDEALGVLWSNAAKLIRRDLFVNFTRDILPSGPPMHLWVDYRIAADGDLFCRGFTHGMKALGLMEIEAVRVPESPRDLEERFIGLGAYLIENGMMINDGDTIGEDEHEKIRVLFSESEFGHDGRVMRLVYEHTVKPKPRSSCQ